MQKPIVVWPALATQVVRKCVIVQPARAEVIIEVSYSEAADLYSTIDNVSGWLEGFTWPEYRAEWEQRFGWSEQDQEWSDRYKEFRRRTFIDESGSPDPRTLPDGIFASETEYTAGTDPLATYFLAQPYPYRITRPRSGLHPCRRANAARVLPSFRARMESASSR